MHLDLFGGPGGWPEGGRSLGHETAGLELDHQACRTRVAAGHPVIRTDVTTYPTWVFRGRTRIMTASPVCPSFSKAGKGLGITDLPLVQQTILDLSRGLDTRAANGARCLDERSILTAEPMRWLYDLRPQTVCMEQVPAVLPLWEQYAGILRTWGYSAVTGVLKSAGYGVPQNRPRAVLIASTTADMALPEPTHGGPGQPSHVSMADAIGWGYTQRPAPTVTGGGTNTGGAEPFGNGSRQAMRAAMERPGEWATRTGVDHLRPTLAECAALQGFPTGYPFQGNAGQQYMQAGNAVPIRLAAAVLQAALQPAALLQAA